MKVLYMEPVAWMLTNRHGTFFGKEDGALRPETISLYSATQFAILQSAKDQIASERDELIKAIVDCLQDGDTLQLAVRLYLLQSNIGKKFRPHNADVTGLAPTQEEQ